MKLDKIKFAKLISYITEQVHKGCRLPEVVIGSLDELIDIDVPEPQSVPMLNPETLHVLMALMHDGTRKIEAIKQHRMMTGYGLKESKDIVEKYWPEKAKDMSEDMIAKINKQINNPNPNDKFILDGFSYDSLCKIKDFIVSFQ